MSEMQGAITAGSHCFQRLGCGLRTTAANLFNGAALLLFLPRGDRLRATPGQVGLWLALSLLVSIACEMLWTETPRTLNRDALPIWLSGIFLTFGLALLIDLRRGRGLLAPRVLLLTLIIDLILTLVMTVLWYCFSEHPAYPGEYMYLGAVVWWQLSLSVALAQAMPWAGLWRWPVAVLLFAVIGLYNWSYPLSLLETDYSARAASNPRPLASAPADESLMYRQNELLQQQLAQLQPQRPGVVDLYFVGVAGDAGEPVFQREVQHVASLMKTRFDAGGRSVLLVNHEQTSKQLPLASQHSLAKVLKHIGTVADPAEDLVFIYLSSHGSRDFEFLLDYPPLPLRGLRPLDLAAMLKDSGIGYHAVVVSACYAGGFIAPLRHDKALIMTAADADSTSFGCGADTHYTWFGEALFGNAMKQTRSLEQGFEQARALIVQWEKRDKMAASDPQLAAGVAFKRQWATFVRRLQ